MENLSLNEAPAVPASQPPTQPDPAAVLPGVSPQQGAPQLPPQMFTTAAQLLDLTDST